jgi:hypothetical protein
MFSNVKLGNGLSLGHIFTFLSIFCSLFFCATNDLKRLLVFATLILFSAIYTISSVHSVLIYFYKIASFFPIIVLARRASMKTIYLGSLYSFLISTVLALIFVFLGLYEHKFIIYYAEIPRFAAFVIEPAGYALASMTLFFLYIFSERRTSWRISLIYYIPIIFAISSVIILKIISDFSYKINAKMVMLMPLFILIILLVADNTRVYDSIDMRVYQYLNIIKDLDLNFFGAGFYNSNDSTGLFGLLRVYIELGAIFFISLILYFSAHIVKRRLYQYPFLIIGLSLPLITETYAAPFLWLIPVLILTRKKMELVS